MTIPYPISEIADRYSICLLKQERTTENLDEELALYEKELKNYLNIMEIVDRLYDINGKIWDLEADIRMGRDGELGFEEIGRRAIKIRDLNKNRIAIKNLIVSGYNEGFMDIKINHASDEK
jgi:hypothetical protein